MRYLREISRILVGVVFVFSGFVKGVDPLGTAYRIEDYFIAYQMEWALPIALLLSVILCTFEFSLGVLLIVNVRMKLISWLLLGVMSYFTILTFFDAIYNPVPDCGCFGDAIIMTNWQTFGKNIVLMFFTLIIFIQRNSFKKLWGNVPEISIAGITFLGFVWFSMWNYSNLPIIDFLPWKTGKRVIVENPQPVRIFLTFENIATGEQKEYLSPDYPYSDSLWLAQWKYLSQRVEDPNQLPGIDLAVFDEAGNMITDQFLANPDFQFLVISYDLQKAKPESFIRINNLYPKIDSLGYSMIGLTATLPENVQSIKGLFHEYMEFYSADDIALKMMIRSNPGLMLLKNGQILGKWHYRNVPDFETLWNEYLSKGN